MRPCTKFHQNLPIDLFVNTCIYFMGMRGTTNQVHGNWPTYAAYIALIMEPAQDICKDI